MFIHFVQVYSWSLIGSWFINDIFLFKFEMLQVRENEISQRKWSGGTAHFDSCVA